MAEHSPAPFIGMIGLRTKSTTTGLFTPLHFLLSFSPRFFGLHWYRPIMIEWASQSEFDEIMLDEDVVSDHMPNTLYREMRQLGKQERLFYESEA